MALSTLESLLNIIHALKDLFPFQNYNSELESLKEILDDIKSKMLAAHHNQANGVELSADDRALIEKMKGHVYEAEDVLDEYATRVQLQQLNRESGDGVWNKVHGLLSPYFKSLHLAFSFAPKAKRIKTGLEAFSCKLTIKGVHGPPRRMKETASCINESCIVGREADKKAIIGILLDHRVETDNVLVLTIVGIGGLGKTALAQLVFNDPTVEMEFRDRRFWVCVSDQGGRLFNVKAILASILKSIPGESLFDHHKLELQHLLQKLREKIGQNKFLLVLDDLWTEKRREWLELEPYLLGLGPGGSRVIVTTRSKGTSKAVKSNHMYELQGLSNEHSWHLFEKEVGIEQANRHDVVEMGKEIVKKCANVPLAIKVVGSLLNGEDIDKWRSFHRSGLHEIQQNDDGIMQILKFSYYHLSLPLQTCFAYCALFPKDHEISKQTIIDLWMAQGYVEQLYEGQNIEDAAEEYFQILVKRCFFQDVKEVYAREQREWVFKIHDLMHDIAQHVAGNEIYHVFIDEARDDCRQGFNTSTKIRSYIQDDVFIDEARDDCRNLFPVSTLPGNWTSLRALDLVYSDLESLPDAIGELLHLRYLNLYGSYVLEILPKSFTQLINLQTLNVGGCWNLNELPRDFNKLVNLRALQVAEEWSSENMNCESALRYMPLGMEKLTNLSRLNSFVVADRESSVGGDAGGLQDLRGLTNLRGSLQILITKKYQHVVENGNREGYLSDLKHLTDISIHFRPDMDSENDPGRVRCNEALLEDLQPHRKLEKLEVVCYPGVTIPRWAKQDNFAKNLPNLVRIRITNCPGLRSLPWLGNLPSLKSLELWRLMNLEYMEDRRSNSDSIGGYGAETEQESSFFPSLEFLELNDLPKLKGWWTGSSTSMPGSELGMGDDQSLNSDSRFQTASAHPLPSFPRLSELLISACRNLIVIPPCPTVETLQLKDFNERLQIMTKKEQVRIEMDGSDDFGDSGQNPKIRHIRIDNVGYLKSLPSGALQRLDTMKIVSDYKVESLSEVEDVFHSCSSSLKSLQVSRCRNLRSLSGGLEYLTGLNSLILESLRSLRFEEVGVEDSMPWRCLHQCLRSLKLRWLYQLVDLPKGMQCLTALQYLEIASCYDLTQAPERIGNLTCFYSDSITKKWRSYHHSYPLK